ncbi:endoplasmic reticulum-golgi intermediate compartment-domain-containing protein [Baffinella frigidus]|nr:endoplasmic reticulum-golgi intermediate compartment-domain-containing protein [Cryptophyta sp. CCMP2293]
MMSSKFLSSLRNFDAYPKTMQDYQIKTLAGAAVSIIGIVTMVVLFFGELSLYLSLVTEHTLMVDTSRGEKLKASP